MRALVLTPAEGYPHDHHWAFDAQAAALAEAGVAVDARPWTDAGALGAHDVVLPMVAWGYHERPDAWHALLDRLEREARAVLNPVATLRWNSDKAYLEQLTAAGVHTIPTRAIAAIDEAALEAARAELGDQLVIKPPVSAGAFGTHRLDPGDPLPDSARGKPTLVQPYLRSVTDEGEYSLLFFGGRFSHALVKTPAAGDYRVQPQFGGREQATVSPDGAVALAEAALAAAPEPPAYARVDLLRDNDGALAIIELELIEPALWLELAPDRGASFATAIVERAG